MLDPEAPILPGVGLGGVPVGSPLADVLATAEPVRVIELPDAGHGGQALLIHSFGAIRTWSVGGVVEQVGAFEGYRGRTGTGIGIGSTIAEIRAVHGEVVPGGAENMIDIPGSPGIGLETTDWASAEQPDPEARVVQIYVHALDE